MAAIDQIAGFAREFINNPKRRTPERKAIINRAYREVHGRPLKANCNTCYIEAVMQLIKFTTTDMKGCRYELKKGVVLQVFGDPTKAVTNANLTDELAEWHLKNNPSCRRFFVTIPNTPKAESKPEKVMGKAPEMEIVTPEPEEKAPEKPPVEATEAPVEAPKRKPRKTTKKSE
jgi:hypothetical protein